MDSAWSEWFRAIGRKSTNILSLSSPKKTTRRYNAALTPASTYKLTPLSRSQKYAAIAAGTTALAGTLLGGTLPIIGAILVPSVPVAAAMGLTTAAIRFSWAHRGNHFRQAWIVGIEEGRETKKNERISAEEARREEIRSRGNQRAQKGWEQMGSDGF